MCANVIRGGDLLRGSSEKLFAVSSRALPADFAVAGRGNGSVRMTMIEQPSWMMPTPRVLTPAPTGACLLLPRRLLIPSSGPVVASVYGVQRGGGLRVGGVASRWRPRCEISLVSTGALLKGVLS